jgi:hypothetical protein
MEGEAQESLAAVPEGGAEPAQEEASTTGPCGPASRTNRGGCCEGVRVDGFCLRRVV